MEWFYIFTNNATVAGLLIFLATIFAGKSIYKSQAKINLREKQKFDLIEILLKLQVYVSQISILINQNAHFFKNGNHGTDSSREMLEGQIKKISNILFSEEKIPILAVQIAHYLNILYEKPNKKVSQDYDDLKHNLKEWHDFFSQYTYFDYFKLNVKELTSEKKLNPEELENRISLFIKTIRKN